jgi:hypothetical protein
MSNKINNDDKFEALVINLKACFDEFLRKKSEIKNCKRAFKDLQDHVNNNNKDSKLKNKECAPILRMIFFPFAVKLIRENNRSLSFLMISIISWWLEKKNESVPSTNLLSLLLERKVYPSDKINIANSKSEKLGIPASESHPKSLKIMIKLFEIKDSTSSDCDNLVRLINKMLTSILDEKKENFGLKYIFDDCDFRPLWKLYFDPLLITQALTENLNREIERHFGKVKFIPTDATRIYVRWSDDRNDNYDIKEVERERVDFIIKKYLEYFEWNERQKVIDNIRWEDINFRHENIEFLCKKFLELISVYFKKFDEKLESIAINLNKFLDSLASYGNILIRNVNFFQDFANIILENPHFKLLEKSEEFIQRFIKNIYEKNDSNVAKENKKDFERYLKVLYSENACVTVSSIDFNVCLIKIISEVSPNSLSIVSTRWILNLIKCIEGLVPNEQYNDNIWKVKSILRLIQKNSSTPILKYFLTEFFSLPSPNMQMIRNLIQVFDNELSIVLFLKDINIYEIKCFKASFINLKKVKNMFGYIDAMSFMSKLALKVTKSCGDNELEIMRNENFVYEMLEVFTDFEEYYSYNLMLAILLLSIRFKIHERIIATRISEFLPKFLNNELHTDELKILIEYFYQIDKLAVQENNSEKFINLLLNVLIKKVRNCHQDNATKFEIALSGIEKCLNGNILMDNFVKKHLKDAIDTFKVELLSLIKFPYYQETIIKILFAVIKLEEIEKEVLLQKFSLRKMNAKQEMNVKNKQESKINNLLLFNSQSNEDSKIKSKPIIEKEITDTLVELKDLADGKKKNMGFTNDEIEKQIQENADGILTDNMKDNIFKIIDIINDGMPLLLEGPTGVGKSASITKAAKITNNA